MGNLALEEFLREHGITPPKDNLFSNGRIGDILRKMGCVVDEFNGGVAVRFNLRDALKQDCGFVQRAWHSLASPITMVCIFTLDGVKISGFALVEKLSFSVWTRGKTYEFCNVWNSTNGTPRYYLDSAGRLRAATTLFVGTPMSDEYAADEFKRFFEWSTQFFVQAVRKFL